MRLQIARRFLTGSCRAAHGRLLHADTEPVLQLIKGGQAPLLERLVPKLTEYVLCGCAVQAEDLQHAGERSRLLFLTHCHHLLPKVSLRAKREVAAGLADNLAAKAGFCNVSCLLVGAPGCRDPK